MTASAATTHSTTTTRPPLGRHGVWRPGRTTTPEIAAGVERLGFGALWLGGATADLELPEQLLDATDRLTVATGIVNIWSSTPDELAASFHRIDRRHPGRLLLGIGAGHPESAARYRSPYTALVETLDALESLGVPLQRVVLAALGPRVLRLAAERTAGAHPYLTTPDHTRSARETMGPSALLAPEQKVMRSTDAAAARHVGHRVVGPYLELTNYRANLLRMGFAEASLADGGTDDLIDALVAHGDAAALVARLDAHLEAGADHVAIQVLPGRDDPLPTLAAIAAALAARP
ncbi:LLM class F420-dependent oxidoreductase [Agromyces sp. H66]|uniref:LLM class F420-dependent oxidoreductase n=1 Tax=Agromyces sp. H66 TaxID=2529859 RepID=UPI001B7D7C78|nr:LLM class F420-dependent oxidoreductase [Agromyces sp. H66]